jgi:pheromone shutdown protein TraB
MRTLVYVPVIHSSADLGSIAKEVAKRGVADLGQDLWEKHRRTVEGFWNVVSDYFDSMDVNGVKIYQDGMVAEDEVGKKIAEDTAKAGSKNYELILRLLQRGAILMKTEDFKLVKKEYDKLLAITQAKSITKKIIAFIKYKLVKVILLNRRDNFIANRIEQTLKADEKAILFIGAFHNIKKRLPKDIRIKEVKDATKVKRYQKLLPFYNKNGKQFDELGKYLVSDVV